jgi:hypothetical protein
MSEQQFSQPHSDKDRQEMSSALFAQLVLQQSNMAMMLLGKVPHPETGKTYKDVEAARLFIDQLEVLETKTKGNLTKEESGLLKQSLMNLRLAFVEAVESPEPQKESASKSSLDSATTTTTTPNTQTSGNPGSDSSASTEEEHRKKFSKKY